MFFVFNNLAIIYILLSNFVNLNFFANLILKIRLRVLETATKGHG